MIGQTWAMFVDAYRELNAKKLFWIVMILSMVVVGALACLGINERGLTILWWELPIELFSTQVFERAVFYKLIFFSVGFSIWLTWAAMVLAVISTASIIPDFVSSGSVELALSKPIGRARLFLTKYLTGLLFVALQVTAFTIATFLVIGIRGGSWELRLFYCIPLVILFFSYLYCISAIVGLITRSALTAMLVTGVAWFAIFLVQLAETGILLQQKLSYEIAVDIHKSEITKLEGLAADKSDAIDAEQRKKNDEELDRYRKGLVDAEGTLKKLNVWHASTYAVSTILPKTSNTMEYLKKLLFAGTDMEKFVDQADRDNGPQRVSRIGAVRVAPKRVMKEYDKELRSRSWVWVIGTSVAFEAVLLGAACWIFSRRDF